MLSFDDALSQILSRVPADRGLGAERIALRDGLNRVLANPAIARSPVPPWSASAMDGYAILRESLASLGAAADLGTWELPVVGESRAGSIPPQSPPGTACRIFTGAPLPDGTDTVVMQEDVSVADSRIRSTFQPKKGAHVRDRGSDLAAGVVAIERGVRLMPGHLALLATMEMSEILVARAPVVTILCTGDELRGPGEPDRPGSIAESNSIALAAMVRAAGGIARIAPIVGDDPVHTERAIADALDGTDLLLTVGGVSVGDHDVVRPALEKNGAIIDFWKVAIKPGKPLAVGHVGRTHVLGLPGNPASAMVTFALFGMPLLRAMQGDRDPIPMRWPARLGGEMAIDRKPGRLEFARAILKRSGSAGPGALQIVAIPLQNQSSGAITSMAWGDALIVIPADVSHLELGEPVEIIRLADV